MVVPRFVHAAMKNEPIAVHGDGTQQRCFGHVSDVVEGLVKVLETPECFGQVVNLGNDEEVSILGLASDRITEGHRFQGVRTISLGHADEYENKKNLVNHRIGRIQQQGCRSPCNAGKRRGNQEIRSPPADIRQC